MDTMDITVIADITVIQGKQGFEGHHSFEGITDIKVIKVSIIDIRHQGHYSSVIYLDVS